MSDGDGFAGIAVVGNTANAGTEGVWPRVMVGTNWYAIGTVADGARPWPSANRP